LTDHISSGAASSEAIIQLRGVEKTFAARGANAPVTALHEINLDVPRGAILGVIGRSGAGKSTLIRLVNGLELPSSGSVRVDGVEISALEERALRQERRSIGMIFQHFNLLARRTAFGNVALPLEIAGVSKAEIRKRVLPLNFRAGKSSASALPERWRPIQRCCSRTRRRRRSIRRRPNRFWRCSSRSMPSLM
jgi:D-methionine transport system ATP-binding protein